MTNFAGFYLVSHIFYLETSFFLFFATRHMRSCCQNFPFSFLAVTIIATLLFAYDLTSSYTQAFSNNRCFIQHVGYRIRSDSLNCGNEHRQRQSPRMLFMAEQPKLTEKEAQLAIDKVVSALRKDKTAVSDIGNLIKVTNVLGYGSRMEDSSRIIAVRFNAQFQKQGFGKSSVPLPFGLGQSNKSEGRGTMVGQVKATVSEKTGKVKECSVFRDLGYGRAFNLKC